MKSNTWKYTEPFFAAWNQSADVPLHKHDYFEFVYVLEGGANHMLGGRSMPLRRGDFFLLDHTGYHGYTPIPDMEFRIANCIFPAAFLAPELAGTTCIEKIMAHPLIGFFPESMRLSPTETVFHDDGALRPVVELVIEEYVAHRAGWADAVHGLMCYLLIALLRRAKAGDSPEVTDALTRQVIAYMEKHYAEYCTLHDAAEAMGYSASYLSRRFQLDTGMAFTDYLRRLRIDRACRLLASPRLTVAAVADAVGYRDMTHFHRVFRAETGTTPSVYRNRLMK